MAASVPHSAAVPGAGVPSNPKLAEQQQGSNSVAEEQHLTTAELLFWVCIAALQPCCVALIGVLVRYLQVEVQPPVPSLRITCFIILFSLPVLLLAHTAPRWLLARWRRRRRAQGSRPSTDAAQPGATGPSEGSTKAGLRPQDPVESPDESATSPHTSTTSGPGAAAVAGLARVPTLPGLSRIAGRHPRANRLTITLAVSAIYLVVILLLNTAPRLVDPAVVMLVTLFTVVGVALVGWLFLGVPLPPALPPAAILMIGGSAMCLVPDILRGSGTAGSLTTVSAWMGFLAAVGALCLTVLYLTMLQAYKSVNISAVEVMYWLSAICIVVVVPISLGVEGADWAAQFSQFSAANWAALLFCACVAHVGAVLGLQYATWKLGGNLTSMFFGLRLFVSVGASKIILGSTIVQTGLQVAGVVLVAVSITGYMGLQWRAAKSKQLQHSTQPPKLAWWRKDGRQEQEKEGKQQEGSV